MLCCAGAMTGGGSKVSRGRMGSSIVHDVTPRQLQELERQLGAQTSRLEVLYVIVFDDLSICLIYA